MPGFFTLTQRVLPAPPRICFSISSSHQPLRSTQCCYSRTIMARFSKNDIPKGLHELRAVAIEDAKFKFMVHLLQVKDVTLRLLLHSAMLGLVVAVARTLLELLIVWHRTHLGRGQQSAPATCGESTLAVCYGKLVITFSNQVQQQQLHPLIEKNRPYWLLRLHVNKRVRLSQTT
jgi:hypothetical protein